MASTETDVQSESSGVGVGSSPTSVDLKDRALAKALGPEKSLDQWASAAKYVIATSALAVTISSGLGLTSDTVTGGGIPHRALVAIAVFSALSIIASLMYLFSTNGRLNPSNLDEVSAWYKRVLRRSWLVIVAGAFLGLQTAVLPTMLVMAKPGVPSYTLVSTRTGTSQSEASLTISCVDCALEPLNIRLEAIHQPGTPATALLVANILPDASGSFDFSTSEIRLVDTTELLLKVNDLQVGAVRTQ